MRRNVWKDIANLRIKQLNNYFKSQRHAWMTIILKTKKMDLLENYLLFAHKLFWNVCIWLVLVGPIFFVVCEQTNLHVLSLSGRELVTNVWRVWSRTFIAHVNSNNNVMWVILQNNADWDCFKTLWLRWRSWRFEIHFWRNILCFWKSHISSTKLDVQETNCVSHSSTESLIISLDTAPRLKGLPALELWDLIVSVLGKCFSCFRWIGATWE